MSRHRTTHAILAVIAFLLAAHLLVRLGDQEAQAQSDLRSAATPAPRDVRGELPVASGIGAAGTCPSDINGDAVVNVLDLVDLLLDFGTECPSTEGMTQVVQPESAGVMYRLRSDGIIETTGYDPNVGDLCIPEWCPWELVPDDVPPHHGASIVHITANFVQSHPTLARVWSNGVIERNYSSFVGEGGNTCIPSESWCGWQVVPESP